MRKILVTINVKNQSSDYIDARLRFWDSFAAFNGERRRALGSNDAPYRVEEYAAQAEQRLRQRLPRNLHRQIVGALLSADRDEFKERPAVFNRFGPGRLVLTVEGITYGSMKVELGIPDIDAFIEIVGNNSEAFEAIFGAYVPQAFDNSLSGDTGALEYEISIPLDVQRYIDSPQKESSKGESKAKDKGTAILSNLIQSPLVLPIILVCFLWYYARQDMVDERRISYTLVQTLVTQQTAVIALLKDKQVEHSNESAAKEYGSATTVTPPPSRSAEKNKAN